MGPLINTNMWIDVKEELPNTEQKVLIYYTAFGKSVFTEARYIGYEYCFMTSKGLKKALYWNPDLPINI